eukprot:1184799-Prorocentrum_minimum.AAC.7
MQGSWSRCGHSYFVGNTLSPSSRAPTDDRGVTRKVYRGELYRGEHNTQSNNQTTLHRWMCRVPRRQWCFRTSSPGVNGQNGLRLQFNSRQSSTVDTSIAFSAQYLEYSSNIRRIFPADRLPLAGRQSTSGLGVHDAHVDATVLRAAAQDVPKEIVKLTALGRKKHQTADSKKRKAIADDELSNGNHEVEDEQNS